MGLLRPEYMEAGKGTVKTMINGQPAYFEVLDPMLLDSITSIGYLGPKSKFLDVARDFKKFIAIRCDHCSCFQGKQLGSRFSPGISC